MKEDNGNKLGKRKIVTPKLFFWSAVILIPLAVLFKEYLELQSTNQQKDLVQQQNQVLEQQIQDKEAVKKKLQKGDPFMVEKDAREKLNFVKPGEVVYKLSTTTTAQNPVK
ncbi:MAG: septum formation initiator family protein [bacterium]